MLDILKAIIRYYRSLSLMQWVVGLMLSALLLPGFLWWRASRAADKMMFAAAESMFPVYDIGYDDTFVEPNGEFGAINVEFDLLDEEGEVLQTVRADRITVRPPGPGWLLRKTALFKSNLLPERMSVVLQNVRLVANPGRKPFDFSALPYEHAGCGDAFTEQDLVAMAGAVPKGEMGYSIESIDGGRSRIRMWVHSVGLARTEYTHDVRLQRPVKFPELLERLDGSRIERVAIEYRDEGFIAKRNAYCARRLGVSPEALPDRLMAGLTTEMSKDGVRYPAQVMARVRQFQQKGGTLRIDTPAPINVPFNVLNDEEDTRLMTAMPLQVAYNGETPVAFRAEAASTVAAAGSEQAPVPNGKAPKAPAAVAIAAPPTLKPGEVLEGERLALAVGHKVEVTTRYGSVRIGELRMKPLLMLTMQLTPEEGGHTLSIPMGDITQIRFMQATASPRSHTSESAPHAKTH